MLPYEACNLGSIAISKFVQRDRCGLDWDSLAKTVKLGVRFLDITPEERIHLVQFIHRARAESEAENMLCDLLTAE